MLLTMHIDMRHHNTNFATLVLNLPDMILIGEPPNDRYIHQSFDALIRQGKGTNINLPDGSVTQGIIREVNAIGSENVVELVVEIGDEYETLFYINHHQKMYSIRNN